MLRLRLLTAALAAALLGAAAPSGYPGSADDQYTALAREYYSQSFKSIPIEATFAGVHTYDAQLGDFSAAAMKRQL